MDTTTPDAATMQTIDDRATAKALIDKLPAGTTLEQIEYHVGVASIVRDRSSKLDEALALGVEEATRRGLLITSEQLQREIETWFKK